MSVTAPIHIRLSLNCHVYLARGSTIIVIVELTVTTLLCTFRRVQSAKDPQPVVGGLHVDKESFPSEYESM